LLKGCGEETDGYEEMGWFFEFGGRISMWIRGGSMLDDSFSWDEYLFNYDGWDLGSLEDGLYVWDVGMIDQIGWSVGTID
jgi:hypothetical protein